MSVNNNSGTSSNSDNNSNKVILNTNNSNDENNKIKKFFKIFLIIILVVSLIGTVTVAGFVFAIIKTSPPLTIEAVTDLDQASQLFDSNGDFMDEVLTAEKRYVISLDQMPMSLRNAFISIEDERFYEHPGVDIQRIIGAVITDIKKIITKEPGLHGASTITQQVIKNNILTNEISIVRKIREIYLALELEKQMSKDQILEVYLNTIFVGGNAYGVEAGALQYFSKNAQDLTIAQSAFLAGATQHPSKYFASAVGNEDPQFYKNRTLTVLSKMLELGYINQEEHDIAVNEVNTDQLGFNIKRISDKYNYEWFSRTVVNELTKDLKEVYGYTDEEVKLHLRNDGLKIYTTMDKGLQEHSQYVLDHATDYINLGEWTDENGIIQPQMSAVVIDYKTGQVKTIVGGRGEQSANSYNRASSNDFLRSIGSTTKPLTAYAPLIDLKLGHAGSGFEDSPLSKEMSDKYGGWNPTNEVKGNFVGYTNVRYALERSINLVAIKSVEQVGLKNALDYGLKFGLHYNDNSKSSIATLALGQFNNDPNNLDGGNPLIVAAAYSVFGNGGVLTEPITYTHVVDKNGKVILENVPEKTQVVSPETAYIMYDLLKGPVERYSSRPAKFGDIPVAGKTGTTENNKDLWFAGLTPYFAGAVWIGADKPTELKDKYGNKPFSGSTASALFGKIMSEAHKSLPPVEIPRPEDIVSAKICSVSGMLASSYCYSDPRGSKVYTEIFAKGTVPKHTCNIHIPVTVNSLTGAIATANTPDYLKETRIFLDRKYTPSVYLGDQKYVAPKFYDNEQYEPTGDGLDQDGVDPDEEWFDENNGTNNPEEIKPPVTPETKPDDNNGNVTDNNNSSNNGSENKPSTPDNNGSNNSSENKPSNPDNNTDNNNGNITDNNNGSNSGNGSETIPSIPDIEDKPSIDNGSSNGNNNQSSGNSGETVTEPTTPPDNNSGSSNVGENTGSETITPPEIKTEENNSSGLETIDDNRNEELDSADFDFG